ncbi:MAG TPA: DUF4190 domain-containing protein [Mycobacteriales bacterium]|nr:DUF4190 domain-containing protein [Mycobacteriales bacterium]
MSDRYPGQYPPEQPDYSAHLPAYGQQPAPPPGPGYGPYVPPPGSNGQPGPSYGPPTPQKNGLGTAAMVLGIVSIPAAVIYIGLICGILAIVFGIIGLRRVGRGIASNRSQAISGLVLGAIGVILSGILIGVLVNRVSNCTQYPTDSSQFRDCVTNGP